MAEFIDTLNGYVWSTPLVALCLLGGLYFSICTRFLQLRHFKHMIKLLFVGHESKRGVSSFQALALSISGRVGVGNIAGVATAIAFGGPGAIFWMWMIAIVGASTAYIESTLAQMFKVEQDGQLRGGPAYYIERGLNMHGFAVVFAIVSIVASGFFLPGVQANSIASGLSHAFDFDPLYSALALSGVLGLIIFGGVKRISHVAEFVVPFMAFFYVVIALVVIGMNYEKIPQVFMMILKSAFALDSTFGGMIGFAISWGVKRGVYSNEAGQGTGAHAAAAAEVQHPAQQGLVQAFSIYIDTLFVCTATAFMILMTGAYNVHSEGGLLFNGLGQAEVGPYYTQMAVESQFPGYGSSFVAVSLVFFAFTTLMAFYYIAETNIAYLSRKFSSKGVITALRLVLLIAVFMGCIHEAKTAWAMGDLAVGVMAWLNLVAIILLRKPALAALYDYERQLRQKVVPSFRPEVFDIADETGIWGEQTSSSSESLPRAEPEPQGT